MSSDPHLIEKIENVLRPHRGAAIVVTDRPEGTRAVSLIGAEGSVPSEFIFKMLAHLHIEMVKVTQAVAGHYRMTFDEAHARVIETVKEIGDGAETGKMIDEDRLPRS